MKSEADERGMFGQYGGRFVPEMLISALDELVEAATDHAADRHALYEQLAEIRLPRHDEEDDRG